MGDSDSQRKRQEVVVRLRGVGRGTLRAEPFPGALAHMGTSSTQPSFVGTQRSQLLPRATQLMEAEFPESPALGPGLPGRILGICLFWDRPPLRQGPGYLHRW